MRKTEYIPICFVEGKILPNKMEIFYLQEEIKVYSGAAVHGKCF